MGSKDVHAAKQLIFKIILDNPLLRPSKSVFSVIITAYVEAGEIGQALGMTMLLESIGLYTCDVLMYGYSHEDGIEEATKILEEAKKNHSMLITPPLYGTLICGYCKLQQFDEALKILT